MRFLYEDPWDRLRKMRKLVPNIPFQCLLRGANGVAYSSLPDNAIYHFCEQAKKNGMDIFRVFDALNDVAQLEVGIKAVLKAGAIAEGTVCYRFVDLFPLLSDDLLTSAPLVATCWYVLLYFFCLFAFPLYH
jgi:pyruvate carboxylase